MTTFIVKTVAQERQSERGRLMKDKDKEYIKRCEEEYIPEDDNYPDSTIEQFYGITEEEANVPNEDIPIHPKMKKAMEKLRKHRGRR